jgi:ketosteroid isomerase-like protein
VRWVAHLDPSIPWAGDYSGKDNLPQYFQALGSSVEMTAHTVSELVAADDTVGAIGDVSFRPRATGKESSSSSVYIWKLRDGQVCGFDQFNDTGLAAAFRKD